jgi:hypothetical protein
VPIVGSEVAGEAEVETRGAELGTGAGGEVEVELEAGVAAAGALDAAVGSEEVGGAWEGAGELAAAGGRLTMMGSEPSMRTNREYTNHPTSVALRRNPSDAPSAKPRPRPSEVAARRGGVAETAGRGGA